MQERKSFQMEVGNRVRELRKARGMTMAQLAEAADMSVQYISEIEHGKKSMTMGKVVNLAEALRVTTDRLLKGPAQGCRVNEEVIRRMEEMAPIDLEFVLRTLEQARLLVEEMGPERK